MSITGILLLSFGLIQQVGWSPNFASPDRGVDIRNLAIESDGDIVVSGFFDSLAGEEFSNMARFDGTDWVPFRGAMGSGPLSSGFQSGIADMIQTGAGDLVIVISDNELYRWTNGVWQSVQPPSVESPFNLTGNDGSRLFAGSGWFHYSSGGSIPDGGGSVSGTGVREWNGYNWTTVGNLYYVHGIASGADGSLFASGTTGSETDYFIGEYDESTDKFERISEQDKPAEMTAASDGRLYVRITSGSARELSEGGLHVYDGLGWTYAGFPDAHMVRATHDASIMFVVDEGDSMQLFRGAGTEFEPVAAPVHGNIRDYALDPSDDSIVVLASATTSENIAETLLMRWTGTEWKSLLSETEEPRWGSVSTTSRLYRSVTGELFAWGHFPAGGFVQWTGEGWMPSDLPLSGRRLYAGEDGNEYVLGRISGETGVVSRRSGDDWISVADAVEMPEADEDKADIRAIHVTADGSLYAGGTYKPDGPAPSSRGWVGKWNGQSWDILGRTHNGKTRVHAITVLPDGSVVAGGRFDQIGTTSAANVARYDGTGWSAMSDGLFANPDYNPYVGSFTMFGGQLVAAGKFTESGQEHVGNIAAWDGEYWTPLGKGMNGRVDDIQVLDDRFLFAAGQFRWAGNRVANNIAVWDGSEWADLDGGTDGQYVSYVVPVAPDSVWIAGNFQAAGGIKSNGVGVWTGLKFLADSSDSTDRPALPEFVQSVDQFPNPSRNQTVVYVRVAERMNITGEVYDLLGRRIARLETRTSGNEFRWDFDVSSWSSGIYTVTLRGPDFAINRMMTVIR